MAGNLDDNSMADEISQCFDKYLFNNFGIGCIMSFFSLGVFIQLTEYGRSVITDYPD